MVEKPEKPAPSNKADGDSTADRLAQDARTAINKRVGAANETTEVQLNRGDTLFELARKKYHTRFPIEAIYEANGMTPDATYQDGRRHLKEPPYFAGKKYILPALSETAELTRKYWERVDKKFPEVDPAVAPPPSPTAAAAEKDRLRLGAPDERTSVQLRYEDTFWNLSERKYGPGKHYTEAILEANGLTPTVKNGEIIAPTYYAGKRYILPAESEVPELTRRLRERLGLPTDKPPENPGTGNGGKKPGGDPPQNPGGDPSQKPGDPSQKPADPSQKPADPSQKPADPSQKPADPSQTPGPGTPDTPGTPGSGTPPEAKKGPDLNAIADKLAADHNKLLVDLERDNNSQGIIGRTFDAAKTHIGTSSTDRSWYNPKALWSQVFDYDNSSKAVREELAKSQPALAKLKQAAQANDQTKFNEAYKELTGQSFDPNSGNVQPLREASLNKKYDDSQKMGVETITDIGAGLAAVASLRFKGAGSVARSLGLGMGTGAVLGAGTKAGLKQIDGRYADLKQDLITGGIVGMTVPIGELAGSSASRMVGKKLGLTVTGDLLTARIETQGTTLGVKALSAMTKAGVSGATFGAIESPGRLTTTKLLAGEQVHASDILNATVKGAVVGFVGGTVLGFGFDRVGDGFRRLKPGQVKPVPPSEVNGVAVSESGGVGLEGAARIMGKDPAEFAAKAASQPFEAVKDVASVYEKHGVNVRVTDPVTGAQALPEPFAKALKQTQAVDALTPGSKVPLQKKVDIVKSANEFVDGNQEKVAASFDRLQKDSKFQEVMRLKTEQEGKAAAEEFSNTFRTGMNDEMKVGVAVERVKDGAVAEADAFARVQTDTEARYLQKAADFFQDMTDPAQRERLNTLVDDIFTKFTPEPLTRAQIGEIINQIAPEDRALAAAIMERSSLNMSDMGLKAQLKVLSGELSKEAGTSMPSEAFTLSPDSSGNLLGYLFRKSNGESMSIRNIDKLVSQVEKGEIPHAVYLFDDLSAVNLTEAQLNALKKVPKVYVSDLNAFERGINIIDVAKGPEAVLKKLTSLLEQAKQLSATQKELVPTGVADRVLGGEVERVAGQIGGNTKIIRPPSSIQIQNMPTAMELAGMEPVESIYRRIVIPKASKPEIAQFLSKYAGEERELAAKMLADGAVHNSFPALVNKAVAMHRQVTEALSGSGLSTRDLLIVSDKDPGGSSHLVSYIYGKVNGLSSENFISTRGLDKLVANGGSKAKAIAYLDDTVYSGSQAANMLDSNISAFMPFNKVIVGSFGAFETGVNKLRGTHLGKIGKATIATAQNHHPFYSPQNPFFGQLRSSQQKAVRNIGGYGGFGDVQGSLIWSYMYPDNNIEFFGKGFSGGVLRLPSS